MASPSPTPKGSRVAVSPSGLGAARCFIQRRSWSEVTERSSVFGRATHQSPSRRLNLSVIDCSDVPETQVLNFPRDRLPKKLREPSQLRVVFSIRRQPQQGRFGPERLP